MPQEPDPKKTCDGMPDQPQLIDRMKGRYYYDDAHGYQDYDPSDEKEQQDEEIDGADEPSV